MESRDESVKSNGPSKVMETSVMGDSKRSYEVCRTRLKVSKGTGPEFSNHFGERFKYFCAFVWALGL